MKKLDKKKVSILVGILLILGIVLIVVLTNQSNNNGDTSTNTEHSTEHDDVSGKDNDATDNTKVSENVVYDTDGTVLYDFEDEKLLGIAECANQFDYLTIIYAVSDYMMKEEIIQSVNGLKYIVSDIDMIKGKDCTINSLELKEGEDPFSVPRLNFKEIFGFSYLDYDNTFDIMMKIAKESGISTNLENSTGVAFNDEMFKDIQEEIFVFNDSNLPIIQEILSSLTYDEVLETVCTYDTYYTDNEKLSGYGINYISATVTYTLNGETRIREVKYTFGLHFEESGWN